MSKNDMSIYDTGMRKVFCSQRMVNIVISTRGIGKTFFYLREGLDNFLRDVGAGPIGSRYVNYRQFGYVRRSQVELDQGVNTLFSPILASDPKKYEGITVKAEGGNFLVKVENRKYFDPKKWYNIGFYMSLSKSGQFKGSSYPRVEYVIFDEFIPDFAMHQKYLKNEITLVLNLMETIFRFRNCQMIFLGNASSWDSSPYVEGFHLQKPFHNDTWYSKQGDIMVFFPENTKYLEKKKKSRFGRLAAYVSPEFVSSMIDNNFTADSRDFIKKKNKGYELQFTFHYDSNDYAVYQKGTTFIIDFTTKRPLLQIPTENSKSGLKLLKKQNPICKRLQKIVDYGSLYYQSGKVKAKLHPLIIKLYYK